MEVKKFGLIGKTLGYSFSPGYFADKFEKEGIVGCQYDAYELAEIKEFTSLISDKSIVGLNVTIPYKLEVMSYLDEISEAASYIGAVNTIKVEKGKLTGHNTDVYGFEESLKELCDNMIPRSALILGTGGASLAVKFVLNKLGIGHISVSRSSGRAELSYMNLNKNPFVLSENKLIINCTPLGTFPDVEECPNIPYEAISNKHYLYDLIYNPTKTAFLKKGEALGATIKNGLQMLELQAEKSWEIWNS